MAAAGLSSSSSASSSTPVLNAWEFDRVPFQVRVDEFFIGAQHRWVRRAIKQLGPPPLLLAIRVYARIRLDSKRSLPAEQSELAHLEIPVQHSAPAAVSPTRKQCASRRQNKPIPVGASIGHTFTFAISLSALPLSAFLHLSLHCLDLGVSLGFLKLPLFDECSVLRQGRLLLPLERPRGTQHPSSRMMTNILGVTVDLTTSEEDDADDSGVPTAARTSSAAEACSTPVQRRISSFTDASDVPAAAILDPIDHSAAPGPTFEQSDELLTTGQQLLQPVSSGIDEAGDDVGVSGDCVRSASFSRENTSDGSSDESTTTDENDEVSPSERMTSSQSASGVLLETAVESPRQQQPLHSSNAVAADDGFLLIDSPTERLVSLGGSSFSENSCDGSLGRRRRRRGTNGSRREQQLLPRCSSSQEDQSSSFSREIAACFRAMSWFKLIDLQLRRGSSSTAVKNDVSCLMKYCERDLNRACQFCPFVTLSCYVFPAPLLYTAPPPLRQPTVAPPVTSVARTTTAAAAAASTRLRAQSTPPLSSRDLCFARAEWMSLSAKEALLARAVAARRQFEGHNGMNGPVSERTLLRPQSQPSPQSSPAVADRPSRREYPGVPDTLSRSNLLRRSLAAAPNRYPPLFSSGPPEQSCGGRLQAHPPLFNFVGGGGSDGTMDLSVSGPWKNSSAGGAGLAAPPWLPGAHKAPHLMDAGVPVTEALAFASSVDWKNPSESERAAEIVASLPKAPTAAVLTLLTQQPAPIRAYGLHCLLEAPEDDLLHFLPQLVQAIRWDVPNESHSMLSALLRLATHAPRIACALHWSLMSELGDVEQEHLFIRGSQRLLQTLADCVEGSPGRRALRVLEQQRRFVAALRALTVKVRQGKDRADKRTERLQQLLVRENEVAAGGSPATAGVLNLVTVDNPFPLPIEPYGFFAGVIPERCKVIKSSQYPLLLSLRLLLPPNVNETGVNGSGSGNTGGDGAEAAFCVAESVEQLMSRGYREVAREYLFKTGDDLRQDQLAVRLIKLIRAILTEYGCSYDIVVYDAVPFSRTDGLIEFVSGSTPLSVVKKNYSSLRVFFNQAGKAVGGSPSSSAPSPIEGKESPTETAVQTLPPVEAVASASLALPGGGSNVNGNIPFFGGGTAREYGMRDSQVCSGRLSQQLSGGVLDTFVRSCAAYSVITFLLGVGDRHLDNLLVCPSGEFFHVDFGFILGEDPKPFPPPMKLCSEIVEVLGGAGSERFTKFQLLCCQCFRCIRRHSRVINDVLVLMSQSGVQSLTRGAAVLERVRERFQLHVSEVEAESYLLDIISVSVNALFPAVVDKFHEWALYWR